MEEKRYQTASAISPKGNLWIIGGSNGSNQSKTTEVYDYQRNGLGNWHEKLSLPAELEKGGVSSQCVVTINSTNVFMAGGYVGHYRIIDKDTDIDEIEAPIVGGRNLNNAWMFDGSNWKALAIMSTPRDRPACSLVHMDDDSVS